MTGAAVGIATRGDARSLAVRLWIYQAERFPIFEHGALILSFASSAVCVAALLAGQRQIVPAAAVVAFVVSFGAFLLLRIADEFKDAAADARYRPERPVPRGLVSLRELGVVAAAVVTLQALVVARYEPGLLALLGAAWAYQLLMSCEFFVPAWLRARPLLYMGSHMLVMPLLDLLATACVWWSVATPPHGLHWFLALSFCNGLVIEIGRKTWTPEMERLGVESYSAAWGVQRALAAWLAAAACALLLLLVVAVRIDFVWPAGALMGAIAACMLQTAVQTARNPTPALAARLPRLSAVWVLASYLVLGAVPMVLR
jgi:4-hydroxybenzoate polyprenyltransferase